MTAPVIVNDPLTLEMLARYRAMTPAAKQAFTTLMAACVSGVDLYPAALKFMQAMGYDDPEGRAARFAAEMYALGEKRLRRPKPRLVT